MKKVAPNPQITSLQPYKPGMPIEELARLYSLDASKIIKVASNENPLGYSIKVAEQIKLSLSGINRYPDQFELRQAVAKFHDLDESTVILGNGSNDIIDLIARVYLDENSESLTSEYAFIIYKLVSAIAGAQNIVAPAKNYGHDLNAMSKSITNKTKVIWIANPNNPTGTFIDYTTIISFLKTIPSNIVVVLDEAYNEYLPSDTTVPAKELLEAHPNIIILRTFSKIYGLAGLRVGYGLADPHVADYLNRVRHPFNVNSLGLAASITALEDQNHVNRCREYNHNSLTFLQDELSKLDLEIIPSAANFVTAQFKDGNHVHEELLKKGIITRPLPEYGLPNHVRISIGTESENEKLLTSLKAILTA